MVEASPVVLTTGMFYPGVHHHSLRCAFLKLPPWQSHHGHKLIPKAVETHVVGRSAVSHWDLWPPDLLWRTHQYAQHVLGH